ncbi:MAG: sigma-54-dependent Fis family transcriptional regulator [Bacteroidales bacterium]|nr:sigma-54-dependent Fis family transcriptional regulator [Bacteroidales bacterium]
MSDIQSIKRTYGIIGNDKKLNLAIETATQVASSNISVLITGESGTGKDIFPKIIHDNSPRKHGPYFAINCGAIPEGTIDSELFGHEKGAFTGAIADRKGYFEIADGGTLFLDEVGELPLSTQARLLRVLENGEYIKVGSSKVMKTNVRVVAATNVNLPEAILKGKFRGDLYYRLNAVSIEIPALRERKEDIYLLFRKFASDFAQSNHTTAVSLTPEAVEILEAYPWDGNIRQLKNITEQISIMEGNHIIAPDTLERYLPKRVSTSLMRLPGAESSEGLSERDLLYRVLFDMKKDIAELRAIVNNLSSGHPVEASYKAEEPVTQIGDAFVTRINKEAPQRSNKEVPQEEEIVVPDFMEIVTSDEPEQDKNETLSLEHHEKEMIRRSLEKHNGKRKEAAMELGISERTLYRKIKTFGLE